MGCDWGNVRLGDHCVKIGSGATPRGGKKTYMVSGTYRLVRSQNVYNDGFNPNGIVYITGEQAHKLDSVALEADDILLNITGDSVARVCQIPGEILPARVNQHVAIIRPNKSELDPSFVRYFLSSPIQQNYLLSLASSGGTRNALTKGMIEEFSIPYPSLRVQHRIAHILGTLDDKIELNRRMNQTLEAIAEAIFKSWFIDFDPVHAKAEGRDTGLPAEIAGLFPSEFEESEIGAIPKGWETSPIGEAVRCVGGATPRTKNPEYWEGGKHAFVTPKDMSKLVSPIIVDSERHITDAGVEQVSSRQLPVGTVVLSSRAPIGYLGITTIPVTVNQGVIAMICESRLPNLYVLHWTRANMNEIKTQAGGTTFAEISKRNFRPIAVLCPDDDVMSAFMARAESIYQRIKSNVYQNRTLASLRDMLLPKLLTGQIDVSETEDIAEETTA